MDVPISVIIPFYNRADVLARTLAGLGGQEFEGDRFEVCVVDDGSTQETSWLRDARFPFHFQLVRQENRGPAAARNLGARNVQGGILLFLDADIIPHRELLAKHLEIHVKYSSVLVCGAVLPWRNREDSFLYSLIDLALGDTRNRYPSSTGDTIGAVPYFDTMSGNLSLSRDTFLRIGGFDEELRAHEDVEFGYRATSSGLQIIYAAEAIGFHNHPRTLQERCRQCQHYASYAPLLFKKHPELFGRIDTWAENDPIDWHRDSAKLIRRKIELSFLALPVILSSLKILGLAFERHHLAIWLSRFIYWRLLNGYRHLGYREGKSRY